MAHAKKSRHSQWHQDAILAPILGQIKDGFFVESGARDGEEHSNLAELQKSVDCFCSHIL